MSKCIPKEMRLQPLPENVCTEQRVSEVVRQRIPGHRTSEGENPMAERAATMSWYEEMVAAGRSKLLTTLPQKKPTNFTEVWYTTYIRLQFNISTTLRMICST